MGTSHRSGRTDRRAERLARLAEQLSEVPPEGTGTFQLVDDDLVTAVREAAVRLLGVRARSREELRRRLLEKGFPPPTITGVLDRLEDLGLVDDAAFARQWVRERSRTHYRGGTALAVELQDKGVAGHHIDEALADLDEGTERHHAERLIGRKIRPLTAAHVAHRDERARHRRRLLAMLSRRGYGAELSREVVDAALGDIDAAG